MASNSNITFHLSRGNPSSSPLGVGIDKVVYGKSLGGQIFEVENLLGQEIYRHFLRNDNQELFDPIVPSDVIRSPVNYRALFVVNRSVSKYVILNEVSVSDVVPDDRTALEPAANGEAFAVADVDISIEGVYTLNELNRKIPADFGKPGNPSLFLADEIDSTNRLFNNNFAKSFSGLDLPLEIPPNCALKIWVRRTVVVDKIKMPYENITENFTITVKEYTEGEPLETSLTTSYQKSKGRIPLSNWFSNKMVQGNSNSVVFKELLPKQVDVSLFNIIKTFSVGDKIVIYYYVFAGQSKNYFLLSIDPNENVDLNKYVQIQLNFSPNLDPSNQSAVSREIVDIRKSFYDENRFYIFWNEEVSDINPCQRQFFGYTSKKRRISVDELYTHIWTGSIFDGVLAGYESRKFETYSLLDFRVIREYKEIINVEHFDDLFILFCRDKSNFGLENIKGVNLSSNELLYVFEKDIIEPEKYSQFKHYPGVNSQVFSQRLYPSSFNTVPRYTSQNMAKNSNVKLLLADPESVNKNTNSFRTIKVLADGSRYVTLNSCHGKSFATGDRLFTYELPRDEELNGIATTVSFSVVNDEKIYSQKLENFTTEKVIGNVYQGVLYEKPLFQQNIIDISSLVSLSVPIEWVDRIYKDEWKTIISAAPVEIQFNQVSPYTLQYNFGCNSWRSVYLDKAGNVVFKYHEKLTPKDYVTTPSTTGTSGVGTSGTSATSGYPEICKNFSELNIKDLDWIIEPEEFQQLTVQIVATEVSTKKDELNYMINVKVYYKGNETPLADILTFSNNISNLSYLVVNSDRSINMRVNYYDVSRLNGQMNDTFRILNLHRSYSNKLSYDIGGEVRVDPQVYPNQAEYGFYKTITIRGLTLPKNSYNPDSDLTIPLVIYGNGYKFTDSDTTTSRFLTVDSPFDFSKCKLNDTSIILYGENSNKIPLKFKVGYYDYERDFAVIFVRLKDVSKTDYNVQLFYSKTSSTDSRDSVLDKYEYLKSNLYSENVIGAWHFDRAIDDPRIAFSSGKVFNAGEPVIYEKSTTGELSLSQIDKEYMYGVAKIYKSHKFNLEFDIQKMIESDLLTDVTKKQKFEEFIRESAKILKPSYTQLNSIKTKGIAILESGEGQMGTLNNRTMTGLVAMSPNANVNTFYERVDANRFNAKTSFNGFSQNIDWVVAKPIDTKLFKSGVLKVSGKLKSDVIKFDTPFKNGDYFVFLSNPANQKIYWNTLCPDRFAVTASHYLNREVAWMAFHKDIFGGVFTPGSIYVGKRTMVGRTFVDSNGLTYQEWPGEDADSISFPSPASANLTSWYNNELIIKPEIGIEGEVGSMNISPTDPGYSVILSSNENINMFWTQKGNTQFNIKTSSPVPCVIHYLVVRNGVEWWDELV